MTELEREIQKYKILALGSAWAGGCHEKPKFLWDVCGKPSVQWAVEAVKGCKYVDRVVFITEDYKIRQAVEKVGVFVIERPINTAYLQPRDFTEGDFRSDTPRSLRSKIPAIFTDQFEYARYWLREREGYCPDLILHFGPEYPLVTSETADKMVETFIKDKEAWEATTFYPAPHFLYLNNENNKGRPFPLLYEHYIDRQKYMSVWTGGTYHLYGLPDRTESRGQRVAPVYISEEEGLSLHNEDDLFKARCYMKRRLARQGKSVDWKIE